MWICYQAELSVMPTEFTEFESSDPRFGRKHPEIRSTTCLVSASGGALPFCSLEHMHAFTEQFENGLGPHRIGQTSPKVKYCSHCVICGAIIRRPAPGTCMIHGGAEPEPCPDADVYGTLFSRDLIRHWAN